MCGFLKPFHLNNLLKILFGVNRREHSYLSVCKIIRSRWFWEPLISLFICTRLHLVYCWLFENSWYSNKAYAVVVCWFVFVCVFFLWLASNSTIFFKEKRVVFLSMNANFVCAFFSLCFFFAWFSPWHSIHAIDWNQRMPKIHITT